MRIFRIITSQIFIAIICLVLILVPTIQAQSAQPNTTTLQLLKVSPVIIRPTLNPGQIQSYTIEIENLLDQPMPLTAQIEGFDASDEESGFALPSQLIDTPLSQWITISPKDIIIPSKSKQTIDLTITIPSQVDLGGYYAMMYLTPNLPDTTLSVKGRIGVLVLASVGVAADNLSQPEIVEWSFDNWLYQSNPAQMQLRIKNPGLYFQSIKPRLTIKPLFGAPKEIFLEEKVVMPGKVRRWQKQFDFESILSGIYFVKLEVSNGDQQTTLYNRLVVFPVGQLILGLLAMIVISLIWVNRKRLERAFQILVKGE